MPSLTVDLSPNITYSIRLEAAGYKTLAFEYTTGTTAATVTKTLERATGTLSVTSTPPGASVTLTPPAGVVIPVTSFTTPFSVELPVGVYSLAISKPGYSEITDTVSITEGVTTTKSYTLAPVVVTVTFSANVPANLYVDGTYKGVLS